MKLLNNNKNTIAQPLANDDKGDTVDEGPTVHPTVIPKILKN